MYINWWLARVTLLVAFSFYLKILGGSLVSWSHNIWCYQQQWQIQDFSEREVQTAKAQMNTYYFDQFSQNCMKMKKIGPRGEGTPPSAPLDPPMSGYKRTWLSNSRSCETFTTLIFLFVTSLLWAMMWFTRDKLVCLSTGNHTQL